MALEDIEMDAISIEVYLCILLHKQITVYVYWVKIKNTNPHDIDRQFTKLVVPEHEILGINVYECKYYHSNEHYASELSLIDTNETV